MELNNHDIILTGGFTQYGFNMDEIISKSKVIASYNRSCSEIQNAQTIELQQISDIITNENENLLDLNRKCEKYNLRSESKLQIAMKSQNSLNTNMKQVTNSFVKLETVIEELETYKTMAQQRNNQINILWKTVNDIQLVEIPEINHKLRVLNENIHNIKSNNNRYLVEIDVLQSEQNTLSSDLTGLNEKLVILENALDNAQHDFIYEQNQNSKLANNLDELQSLIQEKTNNLAEMKHKFEILYNDTIAKIKNDFENEIENEKLKKINIAKRIASECASDDLRLKKLNQHLDATENNLRTQIEHYKNKRVELQKSINFANIQRNNEQKLLMDKTRRIEALNKQKLKLAVSLQQQELKNNELDIIHQTKELEVQNLINKEHHKLVDKIEAMELNNRALRQKLLRQQTSVREKLSNRISLPQRSQTEGRHGSSEKISPLSYSQRTPSEKNTIRKSLTKITNKRTLDNDADDISFLSSISFGSEMNHAPSSSFKLPIFLPLELRNKKIKSAGIPNPKKMVEDPFSSDDSS